MPLYMLKSDIAYNKAATSPIYMHLIQLFLSCIQL